MWDLPWLHANSFYFTYSNSKQDVWRPSVREVSKTTALHPAFFPNNSLVSSTYHDILLKVSLLFLHFLRHRIYVENHIAIKLTKALGLPYLRLIVCMYVWGKAEGRFGHAW